MPKTIPIRKEKATVRLELTAEELIQQTKKIFEIKDKAMKENVHYGIIPGTKKPSLWKPGAEKLCQAFRLEPEFETTSMDDPNRTIYWRKWNYEKRKEMEGTTMGYLEYDSRCTLIHIPTGEIWAKNVSASCNNFESKYRSLNPYDVKNTLEKMSEKRSLVAAVLIGTAASDIFTQDVEDLAYLNFGDNLLENPEVKNSPDTNTDNGSTGDSPTAKRNQIDYIKRQLKRKGITEKAYFKEWEDYFESWNDSDVISEAIVGNGCFVLFEADISIHEVEFGFFAGPMRFHEDVSYLAVSPDVNFDRVNFG